MSKEKPDKLGRDVAYEEACSCPPGSIGDGICRNFQAMYYENWPAFLREVGHGGIGRFYRNNRPLLLRENNQENSDNWSEKETEFLENNESFTTRFMGRRLSKQTRSRLIFSQRRPFSEPDTDKESGGEKPD